jgi:hypothetical protein
MVRNYFFKGTHHTMKWQRLNREDSIRILDSVKSMGEAQLFTAATCEVQKAALSFYENTDLYKITNFASFPSFTFEYLGQRRSLPVSGRTTEQPIYTINDKGHVVPERSLRR